MTVYGRVLLPIYVFMTALLSGCVLGLEDAQIEARIKSGSAKGTVALSAPGLQTVDSNPGETHEVAIQVQADSEFFGRVDLSVDRSQLDLVDKNNDISITLEPSTVELVPNETKTVMAKVLVAARSQPFKTSSIKVKAVTAAKANSAMAEMTVPLQVSGVWEARLGSIPSAQIAEN